MLMRVLKIYDYYYHYYYYCHFDVKHYLILQKAQKKSPGSASLNVFWRWRLKLTASAQLRNVKQNKTDVSNNNVFQKGKYA